MRFLNQCLLFAVIFSTRDMDLFPQSGAAPATLFVTTDLDCQSKLDGIAPGRLEPESAKPDTVSPGKHLIQATSLDGLDNRKNVVVVSSEGQEMVSMELKDARKERIESADDGKLTWIDPSTNLMWQKKDNGFAVNWNEAKDYCRNLRLGGYGDWRLPQIEELDAIYDRFVSVRGYHIKGRLQLSDIATWSSSLNRSGEAWRFYFLDGYRISTRLDFRNFGRALCVRRVRE